MKHVTATACKLAVLVVAMLAAIGAWEISKGTVLPAQSAGGYTTPGATPGDAPRDHFVCYKVFKKSHEPRFTATAEIRNQLEYTIVKVKDHPRLLCVPTAKTLLSLQQRPGHEPDDDDDDDDYDRDRRR